jgi:hypothetical protein
MTVAVKVRVADARRIPHPALPAVEKHYFLVRAADLPPNIPLDANPRDAEGRDLNRRTYRQVRDSLFNVTSYPGTFDLMNKGITCIAKSVKKLSDHEYEITIEDSQGIADGGHTYRLAIENAKDPDLPSDQHVEMRIITGLPDFLIPDIAKGLNTGMQVKEFAIENLRGNYDWIKALIADKPYADKIAWRENEDKEYDVADILCVLECMNVHDFPNNSGKHPISAYEKSSAVLRSYAEDAESVVAKDGELKMPPKYGSLGPILVDTLTLYDRIRFDFRKIYNDVIKPGAGNLKIMDKAATKKTLSFPFAQLPGQEFRLNNGAALPILAAFRNLVRINPKTHKAEWIGGFPFVLNFWELIKEEAVTTTHQAIAAFGRSPNQIGKARPHWSLMHLTFDRRLAHALDAQKASGKK